MMFYNYFLFFFQALQQVSNMNVMADNNTLLVQWDPVTGPPPNNLSYIVRYKLINRDQCQDVTDYPFQTLSSTDASIRITNLEYFSTYTIQVIARQNGDAVTRTMASGKGKTKETGKSSLSFFYRSFS